MKIPRFVLCAALAAIWLTPSGADAQTGHIGPSNSTIGAGIAGIAGGLVAIVVAVAVVHSHHMLSGCVIAGANGPELKTADAKTWSLEGDSANVRPGDRVKLHGARAGHQKGSGANVFRVDTLVKDYGSCEVSRADASMPAH